MYLYTGICLIPLYFICGSISMSSSRSSSIFLFWLFFCSNERSKQSFIFICMVINTHWVKKTTNYSPFSLQPLSGCRRFPCRLKKKEHKLTLFSSYLFSRFNNRHFHWKDSKKFRHKSRTIMSINQHASIRWTNNKYMLGIDILWSFEMSTSLVLITAAVGGRWTFLRQLFFILSSGHPSQLTQHKDRTELRCSTGGASVSNTHPTFRVIIILIVVFNDQSSVWCHLEAVLNLVRFLQIRVGGYV